MDKQCIYLKGIMCILFNVAPLGRCKDCVHCVKIISPEETEIAFRKVIEKIKRH